MENFFVEDKFYSDISDLMDDLEIYEDELDKLPDDWSVEAGDTELQKMFTVKMNDVTDVLHDWLMSRHEDRMSEYPEDDSEKIIEAIKQSVDLDKLNSLIPSLYYLHGDSFTITKSDLIEYCKPADGWRVGED